MRECEEPRMDKALAEVAQGSERVQSLAGARGGRRLVLVAAAGRQLSQADGAAHLCRVALVPLAAEQALLSRGLSSRGLARGGSPRVDARAASEGRAAGTVRRVHSHAGAVECSWWSVVMTS